MLTFLLTNIYNAIRKYKPNVLQKRLHVNVHECSFRLGKQGSQLLPGWADCTVNIRRPASDFAGRGKKAIYKTECNFIHKMVTLLSRTPKSTLGHKTVIRCTCDGCRQQHCNQNCSQTAAWLCLTSYMKSPLSYPTVPSPTPTILFSHSTCLTNRQTTDKRHIKPKARPNDQPKDKQ